MYFTLQIKNYPFVLRMKSHYYMLRELQLLWFKWRVPTGLSHCTPCLLLGCADLELIKLLWRSLTWYQRSVSWTSLQNKVSLCFFNGVIACCMDGSVKTVKYYTCKLCNLTRCTVYNYSSCTAVLVHNLTCVKRSVT